MSEQTRKHPPMKPIPSDGAPAPLLRLGQQLMVLLLAVFGFLFCLITSYTLDLPIAKLALTALVFALLFLAVFSLPKSGLLSIIVLAGGLIYAALHANDLLQGLLLLIERAIVPLGLHLPEPMQLLLKTAMANEAMRLMTLAMQAVLFLVSFLSAFFIIEQPSVPGLALSTLPLLLPAPFYLLSPGLVPFFMLFAAHMMVFAFNNAKRAQSTFRAGVYVPQSRRKANQLAQRAAQHSLSLLALPLIVLSALLASLILPQEGYQRPESIESLQQKIFSMDIGKDAFWRTNDGLTRGDLTSLSSIRFSGAVALKVRVSNHASLYIRDYAGAVYSTNGWDNVSTKEFSSLANSVDIAPQNLLASAAMLGGNTPETFNLAVRNIASTPLSIWTPPGLVTRADEIANAGYVQDTALAFASSASSSEYAIDAIPVGMALYSVPNAKSDGMEKAYQSIAGSAFGLRQAEDANAKSIRSAANAYIDYLFGVYTQLPDETQAAAEALQQTYGIRAVYDGSALNLAATCQAIRSLLSERCAYDYSPPEMPEGVDFATWFLEDAQSGYCVHFATTATVLLRSLGIPARYAEGYIVIQKDYDKQPDAEGYISIEDTHAHAWVEVFDPSLLEWVPVEMTKSATNSSQQTPSASGEPTDQMTESPTENTPEVTPEPTPTPTPEPTPEPTTPPDGSTPDPNATPDDSQLSAGEATPTPAPGDGTQDADTEAEGDDTTADAGGSRPPLWPIFALLGVAAIPLGAFGYRKLTHERLLREFRQKDVNAAVLSAVRQSLKMLRFAGAPEMQPLDSPEQYAYAVARQNPAVDRAKLESLLLSAQRAHFSGKNCGRRDREEAISFANALVASLPARMKRIRRLLFWLRFPAV